MSEQRTVKFRVRDAKTKQIVGYEWLGEDGYWVHCVADVPEAVGSGPFGWMGKYFREQFTGRTDREGKEIYGGDRIQYHNTDQKKQVGIVEYWEEGACFLFDGRKWQFDGVLNATAKVIGSIHDTEVMGCHT